MLVHHHDPHDHFLDKNFPKIYSTNDELQNDNFAYLYPCQMQSWQQLHALDFLAIYHELLIVHLSPY